MLLSEVRADAVLHTHRRRRWCRVLVLRHVEQRVRARICRRIEVVRVDSHGRRFGEPWVLSAKALYREPFERAK